MAAVQELDRLDGNPGSFVAFSQHEGLDPVTPEAVAEYSLAVAAFRVVCIERAEAAKQVTTESE